MIKSVLINLLDYFSQIETFNQTQRPAFILKKLRTGPFLEYLYTNEFLLSSVHDKINQGAVKSIKDYINLLKSVIIAVFSGLQLVLALISIYFFCYMFNQMKKDMLSSHTMIGMLPKHLLQRRDQQKIREFLLS